MRKLVKQIELQDGSRYAFKKEGPRVDKAKSINRMLQSKDSI